MEFICLVFATIGLVVLGRWVYEQNWRVPVKAIALLLTAMFGMFMWNMPMSGVWGANHGALVALFATAGIAIVGTYSIRRWHVQWWHWVIQVVIGLGLITYMWFPILKSGPTSITPTVPTTNSPPNASPTATPPPTRQSPAPRAVTPQRHQSPSSDFCNKLSFDAKREAGCPQ